MKHPSAQRPLLHRLVRPLIWGLCVGVVVGTALLSLAALLMQQVDLSPALLPYVAVAAVALGALAGGLVTALLVKERGLLVGALCGTMMDLLLLVAGLARYGGVEGDYALIKWAVLTLAGAIGGVLGANRKRR